jgi:hypothetical protein
VLDPFCGSGSSLVAARDAGCAYLGIELDAGHHRTACQRLGAEPEHATVSGTGYRRAKCEAADPISWARPFTRYVDAGAA